jgi:hypothetical protein
MLKFLYLKIAEKSTFFVALPEPQSGVSALTGDDPSRKRERENSRTGEIEQAI